MHNGNELTYYTRPHEWEGLAISKEEIEGQVIGRQIVGIYPLWFDIGDPGGNGRRILSGFSIALQDLDTGQVSTLHIDALTADEDGEISADIAEGYEEPEAVLAGIYSP